MSNVATANNNLLKCKVVKLPTEKVTQLGQLYIVNSEWKISNTLNPQVLKYALPQHIYLTSDREIKMDDWYIDDTNAVRKCIVDDKGYWSKRTHYKKIEATTDTSLSLPIIPFDFIGKYVSKHGGIKEVMIEMITEKDLQPHYLMGGSKSCYHDGEIRGRFLGEIKTRKDTVIIHPVKDSWSREEVKELCRKILIAELHSKFDLNEWFEQNIGL